MSYPAGPWVPDPEAIPEELRTADRWVRWKSVPEGNGKPRKVPIGVDSAHPASSTDPTTWGPFATALGNATRRPSVGIGFMLGRNGTRGFVGIDLDHVRDAETGELAAEAVVIIERCATYCEVSPSGTGVKLFGYAPIDGAPVLPRNKGDLDDGGELEVYARGRYFTVTGDRLGGSPVVLGDLSEALAWLTSRYLSRPPAEAPGAAPDEAPGPDDVDALEAIVKRAAAYVRKLPAAVSGEGGHDATWKAALAAVRGFRLSERQAMNLLTSEFNPRCTPPWSERDLGRKVKQARTNASVPWGFLVDKPAQAQGPRPLTETGNAERLVSMFGSEFRWCGSLGWLAWDGKRWGRDDRKRLHALAKETVRSIYGEAERESDSNVRKAIAKWASRSESRAGRESMIALAASEAGIPISVNEVDSDPWILNVANGTVDLRTGRLRAHDRADLLTKLSPVAYHPEATWARWQAFLERVLPDPEIRSFLQRFVGYASTGIVREHVLPILYGTGANGKSVFIESNRYVLGDYASAANPSLLMAKSGESHPTERASLLGKRFVTSQESEAGRSFAETAVKMLTGGDHISARFMHQDEFTFAPTHKLVLATNHKPRVRGDDYGIWRRLSLVPFTVRIPEDERDTTLPEKLRTEASGILRWAVEGCLAWQREGLRPPEAVRAATEAYRQDEDLLAQFLAERCYVAPNGTETVRVQSGEIYSCYRKWCEENGTKQTSQRTFGAAMTERGFERRIGGGRTFYIGVRLATVGAEGETRSHHDR